ncbi:hypothetical protein R3W88_001102 [Solanum pinnatisectum]|uniref:Uncharacterized protein n=1 Tax=Solanum pinnatisectum TaxID=50273 RepID=A0AAV9MKL0_9SOLN|nr:hypothetical protein R3W88_001102 [Solanum pinnatisectum]
MYVGKQCSVVVRLRVGCAARCSSYFKCKTPRQGSGIDKARQGSVLLDKTKDLGKAGQVCWLDKARLWDLTMTRQCWFMCGQTVGNKSEIKLSVEA